MNDRQKFIILKAFEGVLKDALKDVSADVKADLMELSDGETLTIGVDVGGEKVKISLVCPQSTEFVGRGEEFEAFMQAHGMTKTVINDDWKKCVVQAGRNVLWEETGEIVPGVCVQVVDKAAYVKTTHFDKPKVLWAARESGLLDAATVSLLKGGASGNQDV